MKKSFSVIDKQFLRRIMWLLILALFSVLIFWQQTRAEEVDPVASGKGWGAFVAEPGIKLEKCLIPASGQSTPYPPHISHPVFFGPLGPNLDSKK